MLSKEERIRKVVKSSNQPLLICPQSSSGSIIKNIISEFNISASDVVTYAPDEGVEELRNKFKKIYIRPHSSSNKLFVIYSVDRFSAEQANTILKVLEEPPEYSRIILFADSISSVIATIRSRASLVILPSDSQNNAREVGLFDILEQPFNLYLKKISTLEDNELISLIYGGLEDCKRKGLNELNTTLFKILAKALDDMSNMNVSRKLVLEKLYWEVRETKK